MPNILKIGYTQRAIFERVLELSNHSGVPEPYEIAYYAHFLDCKVAEKEVHKLLGEYRKNSKREFFYIDIESAVYVIENLEVPCVRLYFNENNKETFDGDLKNKEKKENIHCERKKIINNLEKPAKVNRQKDEVNSNWKRKQADAHERYQVWLGKTSSRKT